MTLASCAGHTAPHVIPRWFLTPPLHDTAKLYAAGEGATVDDAAKEALNQIASRLSVTISSRWEKRETQRTTGGAAAFDRDITSDLQSRVAEIKFNNYEIVKSEVVDQKSYVLVAVDKEVLLAEKKRDLHAADSMIERIHQEARSKKIVERIRDLDAVAARVSHAVPLVNLIASLDPSFDTEKYFDRYNGYLADGRNAWGALKVLLLPNAEAADVVPVIRGYLSSANIPLTTKMDRADQNLVVLTVQTERKEMEVYGSKAVKLCTLFEVKDTSDRLVASSRIESSGHSMISFGEAGKAASLDLEAKIKKRGMASVLGIDRRAD